MTSLEITTSLCWKQGRIGSALEQKHLFSQKRNTVCDLVILKQKYRKITPSLRELLIAKHWIWKESTQKWGLKKKKTIIDSLSTVRNLRILIIFLKTPIFIFPQWFNPGHDVKKKKKKKNRCGCKTRGETAVIHTMSSTDRRLCEEKRNIKQSSQGSRLVFELWFLFITIRSLLSS